MLNYRDEHSEEFVSAELSINRTIRDIINGEGRFEIYFRDDDTTRKGLLPLYWFVRSVKMGLYPYPSLIVYIADVLSKYLETDDILTALRMKPSRGRPVVQEDLKHANTLGFAALNVWQLVHIDGCAVGAAITETAAKYALGEKVVENIYYSERDELSKWINAAKKHHSSPEEE